MKYRFCSIRIHVSNYDVTFATRGGILLPSSRGYATKQNWDANEIGCEWDSVSKNGCEWDSQPFLLTYPEDDLSL